jgi:hypothetical protein
MLKESRPMPRGTKFKPEEIIAKRLKELEQKNARLKRLLADAELDKAILQEAAAGNFRTRRNDAGRSSMFETLSDEAECGASGLPAEPASQRAAAEEARSRRRAALAPADRRDDRCQPQTVTIRVAGTMPATPAKSPYFRHEP